MPKIKSIEFKGMQETYDLEVEHKDHQYFLSNGILSSNSHAVAYAIDSYYAAWLHTYYETDWLATVLQSENNNPKALTKAISEIKAMDYDIAPPDINYSGFEWSWSEKRNAFVPPLTSIKGLGDKAVEEIVEYRPYKSMSDLLFDEDGKWKHSKLNKTGFTSLCKIEALDSLDEFIDGSIRNHKQAYEIIVGNYNTLRKGHYGMSERQAKKEDAPLALPVLIDETKDVEDWSRVDKLEMYQELCSTIRDDIAFPTGLMKKIRNSNVKSVLQLDPGDKQISWFCAVDFIKKTTKNKKIFYRIKIVDNESNSGWLRVWGELPDGMEKFTIWLAEVSADKNWGPSTSSRKIRPLVV